MVSVFSKLPNYLFHQLMVSFCLIPIAFGKRLLFSAKREGITPLFTKYFSLISVWLSNSLASCSCIRRTATKMTLFFSWITYVAPKFKEAATALYSCFATLTDRNHPCCCPSDARAFFPYVSRTLVSVMQTITSLFPLGMHVTLYKVSTEGEGMHSKDIASYQKYRASRPEGKQPQGEENVFVASRPEGKKDVFLTTSFTQGISKNLSKTIMYLMNGILTLLLINRWIVSGHLPLSNLYESLIFLSWSFTTIYSISSFFLPATVLPTLASSIAPITLLTCGFAFFCVPQDLQKAQSLVPALQSNWLIMHVSVMILSYASLLLGSLFALTLLLSPSLTKHAGSFLSSDSGVLRPSLGADSTHKEKKIQNEPLHQLVPNFEQKQQNKNGTFFVSYPKLLKENLNTSFLDNVSYRFIGLGFVLLTMGIISGAVWANSAWGSYWSWDPKETWAFITWLTYAFYLHLRISKGWYGEQSAGVAIFGFFIVWFCYLGVNLFGKGLHSYAFV